MMGLSKVTFVISSAREATPLNFDKITDAVFFFNNIVRDVDCVPLIFALYFSLIGPCKPYYVRHRKDPY